MPGVRNKRDGRVLAVTVALVSLSRAASAQDPAPSGPVVSLPPVSVEGAGERANGPVIGYAATRSATGTKTDAALIETPQSITVIPREQLDAQDARTLNEALRYTAGVTPQTRGASGTRYDQLSIRGFGSISGVNNTFLDGMKLQGATHISPQVDTYRLERVEVLKGPASILYGQANPGGLFNLVSKLPTDYAFHELEVQGGSFGTIQGSADLSGRLDDEGQWLGRITGLIRNSDGQVDYTNERRYFLQPTVTYRPDSDTTITLQTFYQRDPYGGYYGSAPQSGSLLFNPNGVLPKSLYDGDPGFEKFDRTQYSGGYQAEHRVNDVLTVRQKFRYYHVQGDYRSIYTQELQPDYRTITRGIIWSREWANTYTLDNQAQANFSTGPVRHVVLGGLDYQHTFGDTVYGLNNSGAPRLNVFAPVYNQPFVVPPASFSTASTTNQIGVYLQDQLRLDNWTLLLSGRYDRANSDVDNRLRGTNATRDDGAFTSRVGLLYNFENGIAPYASYAESFQPTNGTSYTGSPFQPTQGTQYEIGIKYEPPGWNSLLTASAFNITQQNVLTADLAHPGFNVQAGEVRSRGFEVEAHSSPLPNLNLVGAYTYLDAEYTKDNGNLQGNTPSIVPRHSASVWGDYTISSGQLNRFGFGGGVRYIGTFQGNDQNTLTVPPTTLVDAVVHYDLPERVFPQMKGAARVQVNATNVFDKRYVAGCYGTTWCFYGPGRTVLASLRYRW